MHRTQWIQASRWVYATKIGDDGEIIYKKRYVAKGYMQRWGEYGQTWAPTRARNQDLKKRNRDFFGKRKLLQ